ncbi:MAG: methyl-accepting chemotaxis protein [Steroidobacteraceae bacterium]
MNIGAQRNGVDSGLSVRAAREIGVLAATAAGLVLVAAAGFAWNLRGPSAPGAATGAAIAALQDLAVHATRAVDGDAESIQRVGSATAVLRERAGDGDLGELSGDARMGRTLQTGAAIVDAEQRLLESGLARTEVGGLAAKVVAELRRAVATAAPAADGEIVNRTLERTDARARDIELSLLLLLGGGEQARPAARRLAEASDFIGQVVGGFSGTNAAAGLPTLNGAEAQAALRAAREAQQRVEQRVREAVNAAPARTPLVTAASTLVVDAAGLARDAAAAPSGAGAWAWWPALPALLALVPLGLLFRRTQDVRSEAEKQRMTAAVQRKEADRNQEAILRLLDELSSLADGDLTVQATVTEDITGAIADSINYAVDALRGLVQTINKSAIQLDGAARQTTALAQHLAKASNAQSKQIGSATESVTEMAAFTEEVSGNAERAADVARHSVDVAHKGGDAVRRTIDGMNTIRETIQETSKRIKRLGESSQEIGNIVELINDIAEQTNILALNASIQASMAGEAGRGFAVVADEVQRLAERAANATKQIEVLVRTIQADTNEAVVSMEQHDRRRRRCAAGGECRRRARGDRAGVEPDREPGAEHFRQRTPAVRRGAEHHAQHAGAARDQHADGRFDQRDVAVDRQAGRAVRGLAQFSGRLPSARGARCHAAR